MFLDVFFPGCLIRKKKHITYLVLALRWCFRTRLSVWGPVALDGRAVATYRCGLIETSPQCHKSTSLNASPAAACELFSRPTRTKEKKKVLAVTLPSSCFISLVKKMTQLLPLAAEEKLSSLSYRDWRTPLLDGSTPWKADDGVRETIANSC